MDYRIAYGAVYSDVSPDGTADENSPKSNHLLSTPALA
jgi:hypothetical protein